MEAEVNVRSFIGFPIGGIKQEGAMMRPMLGNAIPGIGMQNINIRGPPPMLTQITPKNPQLVAYARQSYGTVDLDEEQWKQCEEAFKMNLLFQDIARKKARDEELARKGKFK